MISERNQRHDLGHAALELNDATDMSSSNAIPSMTALRMVVVADGKPSDPRTNSGVASGVWNALDRRPDVALVAGIDSRPGPVLRRLIALTSFRPNRSQWKNLYRKGRLATWARSFVRDRALSQIADKEPIDLVLHVRNTYLPCDLPYVCFIDNTAHLSQSEWPMWQLPAEQYRVRVVAETRYFRESIAVATAGNQTANDVIVSYGQAASKVKAVGGGTNLVPTKAAAPPASFVAIFVGREFERKGGAVLLEAFGAFVLNNPGARLVVVGPETIDPYLDGPIPDWLDFRGEVRDRATLSELYSGATVFCLPAIFEPYGLVVQEALAHGLPCIVSDTGALREIVGDGVAGEVVPRGDAEALTRCLDSLARDPRKVQRLADGAKAALDEMTWDHVVDRLLAHVGEHIARAADDGAE